MMYNYIHYVLEFLYYISGILVFGGVVVSWCSYVLTKKDIKLKYSREISSITIEKLELFYSDVIPLYEKIKILVGDTPFCFKTKVRIIDYENNELKKNVNDYHYIMGNNEEFIKLSKDILIHLQLIALSFESGMANSNLFKSVFCDKYIDIFEAIFPVLMQENDKSIYQSCKNLYEELQLERDKEKNRKEKEELDEISKTRIVNSFERKYLSPITMQSTIHIK